jgi:hypothetical protein
VGLWGEDDVIVGPMLPHGFMGHATIQHGDSFLLIPLEPGRARGAAPRRWTDSMSITNVVVRWAFGLALSSSLAKPLLRKRIGIRTSSDESSGPTLHEYLAAVLDEPAVVVAGTWGPPRPNRKPVLRLFDLSGKTLGFAKIGWNPLTKQLVSTEAGFLARPHRTRALRIPALLHLGDWRDHTISITEPALGSMPLKKVKRPGPEVLTELAGLSERYRLTLGTSPYLATLRARTAKSQRAGIVIGLRVAEELAAAREVQFGHWHGDWTPWNMNSSDDRPIVWDWERTAADMPVGMDTIHYVFHANLTSGMPAGEAITTAGTAASSDLAALGIAKDDVDLITLLYALEMTARFGESPVPWLSELLDAAVALCRRS